MSEDIRASVSWAEAVWGRPVQEVRELRGGWTSTILRLSAGDESRAVLRLIGEEPWRSHAAELLARESQTQQQLAHTRIPAPVSIAVDPDGLAAGTPAHLMSWLPGHLELTRTDDAFLSGLARLLVDIHRHDPGTARPRPYQSWAPEAKRVVPGWSKSPHLWTEAFSILEQEPPPHHSGFLHRDFHAGNVLWTADETTGVVDWVETSWGPPELDVAHSTTYLAMLHDTDTAERFRETYRTLSNQTLDPVDQPYWEVLDIVGYLPDPTKVARPWRDVGRDVSDARARTRLELYLDWVLRCRPAR